MSSPLKKLFFFFKSSSRQKAATAQSTEKPVKIHPILEPNHLNTSAIITEEINVDEFEAAQEYFNRNRAS